MGSLFVRNDQPGQVAPGLWCLGRRESNVYLLQGTQESMLISGGTSYILPDVLKQLDSFGLDPASISKCLILHAHFDHVGIIPYFKRTYPHLEIFALQRGWDVLGMDRAIATINEYSRLTAEQMQRAGRLEDYALDWGHDISGTTVQEGDSIDLGGRTVRIIETPGHSSCSLTAYVPELKALFPSDGGGIPFAGEIIPSGNSNYTLYQQSLHKLMDLETDIICADHYGTVTGDEARRYIRDSIQSADHYRRLVEKVYHREQDQEKTVAHLVKQVLDTRPDYFLPEAILIGVTRQMVKHIAREMHGNSD